MNALEIRAELLRRGLSLRSISRRVGVSGTAVLFVVNRKIVSRRIMEAIASAIERDKEDVFPEYYCKHQQPMEPAA